MSAFAPVALFAYRRTDHLAMTLDALECCPEFSQTPVHVFSDGSRDDAAAVDVADVRRMLSARARPNMTIIEAPQNRGLANSVIAGVSALCEQYGRVIVIEDDLVASPALLSWFNKALDRYADAHQVWQVSGHQFAVPAFQRRREAMFLNFSTSWGWATWSRAWKGFDPSASGWQAVTQDAALRRRFDLDGAYPYSQMLEQQMAGKMDSWAIRWWWSIFRAGALSLFPPRPLIANIGQDESATHRPARLVRMLQPMKHVALMQDVPDFPAHIAVDKHLEDLLRDTLWRAQKPAWRRLLAMGGR